MVWTLPPGTPVTAGTAWTAVTPQGPGLASANAENAITALTADGATLTGVGFTAAPRRQAAGHAAADALAVPDPVLSHEPSTVTSL